MSVKTEIAVIQDKILDKIFSIYADKIQAKESDIRRDGGGGNDSSDNADDEDFSTDNDDVDDMDDGEVDNNKKKGRGEIPL